jgi:hypothetical protein
MTAEQVDLELTRRDVGCKTVANMIKGKTPEEIRKLFNIINESVRVNSPSLVFTDMIVSPPRRRSKSGKRTNGLRSESSIIS